MRPQLLILARLVQTVFTLYTFSSLVHSLLLRDNLFKKIICQIFLVFCFLYAKPTKRRFSENLDHSLIHLV